MKTKTDIEILKTVKHGDKMECPTCGSTGRFDVMKLGVKQDEAEWEDAVWFNEHVDIQNWECYDCWLK